MNDRDALIIALREACPPLKDAEEGDVVNAAYICAERVKEKAKTEEIERHTKHNKYYRTRYINGEYFVEDLRCGQADLAVKLEFLDNRHPDLWTDFIANAMDKSVK